MNYAVCRLAFLLHTKNELNRKRRRFLSILSVLEGRCYSHGKKWNMTCRICISHTQAIHRLRGIFTVKQARSGYNRARLEMKTITPDVIAWRKHTNIGTMRNSSGGYTAIVLGEKIISAKEFPFLADAYVAEESTFGEMK
jgi:hypothetical protein